MRVLVTGGIGNVGPAVIERLVRLGHTVRVIGRRPEMHIERAEYAQCDIRDMRSLQELLSGCAAVVHLAALGNPSLGPPETVFSINCQGTFNVYEAAARAGIRRVVAASSINALGFGFGVRDFTVSYLPIDEEHPTSPTDAYSFSKNVVERIADYHWRRDGISGVCLRLPAVVPARFSEEEMLKEYARRCRQEAEELLSLSERQREERFAQWMGRLGEARRNRFFERPPAGWTGVFPESCLLAARSDFWTALDERDSAQAVVKGLLGDFEGSHVLFVNDDHNRTGVPSRTLVRLFYPGVDTWKKEVAGTETLVSIDRAKALLDFQPEYSTSRYLG